MEKSDEEIAESIKKGDSKSFEYLVNRYENKIERYLNKFIYNKDDVTDVLQEVFIKVYVNIQSFDSSLKFSPWIYRISHNEAINFLKKRKPESFSLFDVDVLFPHPVALEKSDTEAERQIMKKMLDETLNQINIKYKEILVLYFYEDLSYKDIALILKIPTSSVGVKISRGKKMVEDLVKKKGITF